MNKLDLNKATIEKINPAGKKIKYPKRKHLYEEIEDFDEIED